MSIAILCLCVCLPIYADGGLVFCGFRAASIHDVATFCLTFFMLANLLDSICIFGPPPKKNILLLLYFILCLKARKNILTRSVGEIQHDSLMALMTP